MRGAYYQEMHSGIITLVNYKFEQEALVRKKIEEMYEEIKKYIDRFEGSLWYWG